MNINMIPSDFSKTFQASPLKLAFLHCLCVLFQRTVLSVALYRVVTLVLRCAKVQVTHNIKKALVVYADFKMASGIRVTEETDPNRSAICPSLDGKILLPLPGF